VRVPWARHDVDDSPVVGALGEILDAVYNPVTFALDAEEAWRVVEDAGAASLVVSTEGGLDSAFAPVVVSEDRRTLRTHLAKANPWTRSLRVDSEVLLLFVAASAYVSPRHYPSRFDNPHVVPTWNYALAQIRATATIHDDDEWKREQVLALTHHFERGRHPEWLVDDLEDEFVSTQLKGIIGLELTVLSIEGKGKLSQNRPEVDRLGVRDAFSHGTLAEQLVARRMPAQDIGGDARRATGG